VGKGEKRWCVIGRVGIGQDALGAASLHLGNSRPGWSIDGLASRRSHIPGGWKDASERQLLYSGAVSASYLRFNCFMSIQPCENVAIGLAQSARAMAKKRRQRTCGQHLRRVFLTDDLDKRRPNCPAGAAARAIRRAIAMETAVHPVGRTDLRIDPELSRSALDAIRRACDDRDGRQSRHARDGPSRKVADRVGSTCDRQARRGTEGTPPPSCSRAARGAHASISDHFTCPPHERVADCASSPSLSCSAGQARRRAQVGPRDADNLRTRPIGIRGERAAHLDS